MKLASAALLLVSLLWGTTFVAVKSGLSDASPLLFVGIRFGLAGLASLVFVPNRAVLRDAFRAGLLLGAVLAVSYAAQTQGLSITTPSRSGFVTGLNVAIVPLWAALLLRRRPRTLSLLGLVIALPGLWLLAAPSAGAWNAGDWWTIVCAIFFALHVVLLNRYGPSHHPGGLLASQLLVTSAICLLAAPVLEEPRVAWTPNLGVALAITALLATVGTTWLQIRFQPRVDPTRAAVIYITEPVFAAMFSWMFTGEVLPGIAWAGGVVILTGMLMSEFGVMGGGGEEKRESLP